MEIAQYVQRLREEGDKTFAFFAALQGEDWHQIIYTEGGAWSMLHLLAHFLSAEEQFLALIDNVLHDGAGAPPDFDIDAFNREAVTARLAEPGRSDVTRLGGELLQRWVDARRRVAALVETMQPADLERPGRHPFLWPTSLEAMIKLIYRHHQIHLRDARRVLGAQTSLGAG